MFVFEELTRNHRAGQPFGAKTTDRPFVEHTPRSHYDGSDQIGCIRADAVRPHHRLGHPGVVTHHGPE